MDRAWREAVLDRLARFEGDVPAHVLNHLSASHDWDRATRRQGQRENRPIAVDPPPPPPRPRTRDWALALDGQDDPEPWVRASSERDRDGDAVAASVAWAVAVWLEPDLRQQAHRRPPSVEDPGPLPPGAYQPDLPFRERHMLDRHWSAWAMKLLDNEEWFATLLDHASDENASVRARIYRSLGQLGHPAAIQCLHEGSDDPHPFARAQAIRSLGWIGDPSFLDELAAIVDGDPVDDVRRIATKSGQRIRAYWLHYGEWWEIAQSEERTRDVARDLADRGWFAVSHELCPLDRQRPERTGSPEQTLEGSSGHYADLFKQEMDREQRVRRPEGQSASELLAETQSVRARMHADDTDEILLGTDQASARGILGAVDDLLRLTDHPDEAVAWNARRALRRLEQGALSRRRRHAAPWMRSS